MIGFNEGKMRENLNLTNTSLGAFYLSLVLVFSILAILLL
jgi:hypothetical protein